MDRRDPGSILREALSQTEIIGPGTPSNSLKKNELREPDQGVQYQIEMWCSRIFL
jgi:hypothetical protein